MNISIFVHGTNDQRIKRKGDEFYGQNCAYVTGLHYYNFHYLEDTAQDEKSLTYKENNKEIDTIDERIKQIKKLTSKDAEGKAQEVKVFGWSGMVTTAAREEGGFFLAQVLKDMQNDSKVSSISIITHSHGGNVLGHALRYFNVGYLTKVNAYLFACPFFGGGYPSSVNHCIEKLDDTNIRWGKSQSIMVYDDRNENLWRADEGGVKKLKSINTFFSPDDNIQVYGASIAHGTSVSDTTNCLDDVANWPIQLCKYNNPHGRSPWEAQQGAKAHTDLNHAFAYEAAAQCINRGGIIVRYDSRSQQLDMIVNKFF